MLYGSCATPSGASDLEVQLLTREERNPAPRFSLLTSDCEVFKRVRGFISHTILKDLNPYPWTSNRGPTPQASLLVWKEGLMDLLSWSKALFKSG